MLVVVGVPLLVAGAMVSGRLPLFAVATATPEDTSFIPTLPPLVIPTLPPDLTPFPNTPTPGIETPTAISETQTPTLETPAGSTSSMPPGDPTKASVSLINLTDQAVDVPIFEVNAEGEPLARLGMWNTGPVQIVTPEPTPTASPDST